MLSGSVTMSASLMEGTVTNRTLIVKARSVTQCGVHRPFVAVKSVTASSVRNAECQVRVCADAPIRAVYDREACHSQP